MIIRLSLIQTNKSLNCVIKKGCPSLSIMVNISTNDSTEQANNYDHRANPFLLSEISSDLIWQII